MLRLKHRDALASSMKKYCAWGKQLRRGQAVPLLRWLLRNHRNLILHSLAPLKEDWVLTVQGNVLLLRAPEYLLPTQLTWIEERERFTIVEDLQYRKESILWESQIFLKPHLSHQWLKLGCTPMISLRNNQSKTLKQILHLNLEPILASISIKGIYFSKQIWKITNTLDTNCQLNTLERWAS